MKAIIIAAGPGQRLAPFTDNKPKCLLRVGGQSIMQRILAALRECGIDDIVVIRGYKRELIHYPGLRYCENTDYENNNILASLFYAEGEMNGELIVSYSDIIYGRDVVEKLLQKEGDISLVVDTDWLSHYEGRQLHPVGEAELVMVENDRVTRIGKDVVKPEEAYGEFIGLAKFSRKGTEILRSEYRRVIDQYGNRPFQNAASLEKAYLTDMIQELTDVGHVVGNVDIRGGWVEVDTPEDLGRARVLFG